MAELQKKHSIFQYHIKWDLNIFAIEIIHTKQHKIKISADVGNY